ncbi:MAG TPA: helix-hairpin-helix domain-containing protein [Phycisphaerales bacterium]|nr:helix-hairpin-helix domain-containing protein [Phycisphaerales bacterium]HMP37418.1 helix-hairpin-helix domain-containing protein [Phycisphaerales bacterium]
MIARLSGTLLSLEDGVALVACGDLAYELLVPACDQMRLAGEVGQRVEFHTLHYLESQGQGASYLPRLIGFASATDRSFFELFTTVKGIGNRKALRAMQLAPATIAGAIDARDLDLLRSLPEIGRKTAETIVLELRERVGRFVGGAADGRGAGAEAPRGAGARRPSLVDDAVVILAQLGESKAFARQLAERALAADPTIAAADALVTAALRLKDA